MDISNNKKIFIAGGRGFIGQELQQRLESDGYSVFILSRSEYQSNPVKLAEKIDGSYAVINLAGATINKPWTARYKAEILESRILSASTIAQASSLCKQPPERFISTSAVGIYDSVLEHTEQSTFFADGFLAEVCRKWEAAPVNVPAATKLIIIRLGVVLGKNGGMLKKLKPLFNYCLGGRMGSGDQAFPFIHIHDAAEAFIHILSQQSPAEIYNLVSPKMITNKQFTRAYAKALHRPAILAVPAFALKILLGKRSALILDGQKVIPEKLQQEGFKFRFPEISQPDFFRTSQFEKSAGI